MRSTIVALIIGLLIIVASIAHVSDQYRIFFDPVGIALVFGGTVVVAFVTFPPHEVLKLFRTVRAVMAQNVDDAPALAREIISLARDTRGESSALQQRQASINNPFLKDGVGLILDRLEITRIETILRDRIRIKQESDESVANMLRTLAKYPPSLGIIGTVVGLIALMLQLGQDGGAARLGPAMAVGLVATLYGLVFTNFLLQPLGENLAHRSYKDVRKRQMVLLGIILIKQGESAVVVQESVNSLLPVSQRVDVLGIEGRTGNGQAPGQAA